LNVAVEDSDSDIGEDREAAGVDITELLNYPKVNCDKEFVGTWRQ